MVRQMENDWKENSQMNEQPDNLMPLADYCWEWRHNSWDC